VLTDSAGRKVSFKNTLIVITTNVGSEVRGDGLGFRPVGRTDETDVALRKSFTPEFLGRLDRIVHFKTLDQTAMEAIARIQLRRLEERVCSKGLRLQLPEELPALLGKQCTGKDGARKIRHLVQEQVEGPLAVFLLNNSRKSGKIKGKLENNTLQFQ
jgi:ATP-dependent Clp protease ATP-binding subunit ClpA